MSSLYVLAFLFCVASLAIPFVWRQWSIKTKQTVADQDDPYKSIVPLVDFDIHNECPIRLRPFKPKYHLTMSIEQTTMSDLLAFDKTYLDRIRMRRSITSSHPYETLAALPGTAPMVHELYTWLFTSYLPVRLPTIFTVLPAKDPFLVHPQPYNLLLQEPIPFPPPQDAEECLRLISSHIDTDFLLLAPRPVTTQSPDGTVSEEDKYHLLSFANCFPSGFRPRDKLGLPLNLIHAPVPGYAAKLERSMDRFFARIGKGEIVKRANWTIHTTGEEVFCLKGNHFTEDDGVSRSQSGEKGAEAREEIEGEKTEQGIWQGISKLEREIERQKAAIRIEDCRLRAERQTLHRLPETGALVFAFKTYTYPLDEVKREEGMAEALAEAILGLERGNVPEMKVYKRQVVWGEKVREFLLS
ncbi:Hypothetical protein D9617_59g026450 [Elsinoe fawcettii]|nr:Hypothetical protein D9617_59g026450 [Elsinoe fawcettii]